MNLKQLKQEFKTLTIPKTLTINETTYNDLQYAIDSLIVVLESNAGNRGYLAYYEKLLSIYKQLKQKQ